jgi:negative regulator of flagellin synthesis FlgM
MKINGSTDPTRLDVGTGKPAAKATTTSSTERTGNTSSVRLTEGLTALSSGDNSAEFDAGRVQQIKESIRDGSFEVDSGVVADKLIANVNDLFGNVH